MEDVRRVGELVAEDDPEVGVGGVCEAAVVHAVESREAPGGCEVPDRVAVGALVVEEDTALEGEREQAPPRAERVTDDPRPGTPEGVEVGARGEPQLRPPRRFGSCTGRNPVLITPLHASAVQS